MVPNTHLHYSVYDTYLGTEPSRGTQANCTCQHCGMHGMAIGNEIQDENPALSASPSRTVPCVTPQIGHGSWKCLQIIIW